MPQQNQPSQEIEVWKVNIPANVYAGKYYDYRVVQVFVDKVAAPTEKDAIDYVNSHKEEVLNHVDQKRYGLGGGGSGKRLVAKPTEKNVFFKDTYDVRPSKVHGTGKSVLGHPGYNRVNTLKLPADWKPAKPLQVDPAKTRAELDAANANRAARKASAVKEDAGHSILDVISEEDLVDLKFDVLNADMIDMGKPYYEKLYNYYSSNGEMPYGTQKARTGDPDQWIYHKILHDYGAEIVGQDAMDDIKMFGHNMKEAHNIDRYADREWAKQLSKENPTAKKIATRLGGDELTLHSDDEDKEDSNDYFSYQRKAKKMKEGYVKQLRKLLEAEVEQAESLIAAKSFSQELQDMVEKLGRLVNETLPAVVEQMRDAYGADVATGFENTVSGTLNGVMDSLKSSKQEIDNSVSTVSSGGMPAASTDMDDYAGDDVAADAGGDVDLDLDADVDLDLDADALGGNDAAAGPEDEPLGRAKKESVQNNKEAINEAPVKSAEDFGNSDSELKAWKKRARDAGMKVTKTDKGGHVATKDGKKRGQWNDKKGGNVRIHDTDKIKVKSKPGVWGESVESLRNQIVEMQQKLAEKKGSKKVTCKPCKGTGAKGGDKKSEENCKECRGYGFSYAEDKKYKPAH